MKKKFLLLLVFLTIMGITNYMFGQILTGSIKGVVKDEEGEVLPGVTVEIKGPALIGGPRTTTTSEKGLFYFPSLPPGIYELTFSLEGFQTLTQKGINVIVDTTVTLDVVLKIAKVEERVTVIAETPVVDVTKSGVSTTWESEVMENLPLLRMCFFDLVNSTPGLWSHYGTTDSTRTVAYGTSSESNVYLFDGVDTTAPDYGAAWAWLNPDVVEELQIIGIGGKAEYGNFMGVTINIVTKSGGNEFSGGAGYLFQHNKLTDDNSKDYIQELLNAGYITPEEKFPYHREEFYDVSFQLGGPIIKDKMWFFLSIWKQVDASTPVGTDPRYYSKFDDTQIFFKTTIQLTKNIKLSGFFNYEWFDLPDAFTPEYGNREAVCSERGGLPTGSFSLTAVLTDRTLFELKYNYSGGYDYYESLVEVEGYPYSYYRGPTYYNANTGVISGGPWWLFYFEPLKHGINASLSHFAEDFLAGDHDFKIGVQYARGRSDVKGGYSAGVVYVDYTYYYAGVPYLYRYKYEMAPYHYGAANEQIGIFIDDTWTVSDRLTLNVGLRYDRNVGWIPDQPVIEVNPVNYDWVDTGEIVPGRPDLVKWSVFSPRFGLAFKLTPDGKTLLRANIGRYYDQIIYGNWMLPSPTSPVWYMYWWNGVEWELVTSYKPELIAVDPNLKNPYSDQFSIGIDREILPNFGLSITYLEKWTKDMIGFKPAVGTWDDYYELITVPDPYTGNPIQVYNLKAEYPEIIISNPDRFYARFRMLSIVFNKRMSNNWQLSASFTFSKMWGLNPRGVTRQIFSENILWNNAASRDPNNFLNLEGPLPGDRRYSIKILGTYIFPFDIIASVNFQIQDGTPYCRVATIYGLNQGSANVPVERRGDNDHRLPDSYLLDLSLEKRFKITDRIRLLARFEVFNLLNRATPYGMMDYSLVSGQQWVYRDIWPPRRVQLGLRLKF
jgi:hypothetical protein